VYSLDSLNVIAVGDSGRILRTTDAGSTWTSQHPKDSINFWDVHLADSLTGVAVGTYGRVTITTNGGVTWQDYHTPGPIGHIVCHAFDSKRYCSINFWDTLEGSSDGGSTWKGRQIVLLRPNDSVGWYREINAAHFFDQLHIVAVGLRDSAGIGALAFVTTDGGVTWHQTFDSVTKAASEFLSLDFADSLFGIGGARNNYYYLTTDGGYSWQVDTVGLPASILHQAGSGDLPAISFASRKKAFAIVSYGTRAYIARFDRTNEAVSNYETQSQRSTTVYPNPVEDLATISFESVPGLSYNIVVTNMLGQAVWRKNDIHSNSLQFRRGDLPSGVYLYRLEGGGTALTGHLVLTH
jgi:photosystem II stability/assembly factor-like uncharacterized protein